MTAKMDIRACILKERGLGIGTVLDCLAFHSHSIIQTGLIMQTQFLMYSNKILHFLVQSLSSLDKGFFKVFRSG